MSNAIGEKIRQLRESNRLTMEEFGSRIGVGKSAVNKYEKGRVENLKRTTMNTLAEHSTETSLLHHSPLARISQHIISAMNTARS